MSQVRKFDKGGNTAESTKKESHHDSRYGHYIVDGKTYDVNDDFINNYIASAKNFNDSGTNRIASYVVNALKSGQDVSFDTLNNRVTGINQYLNADDVARSNEYYSGPQNKKMHRKYQRKEINKNTDLHQTNIGIKNLGSIQFTNPKETISTPTLIDLYGDTRTLDYNKNADGTVTWSTGPQNAGNIAAINNFFDFLGMSNEEADKKYSYKGKENWISDLRNWYTNNPNYKEGLISRMQSNQLDSDDWDILRWMGFTNNVSDDSIDSSTMGQPRSYEGSGFNNDALEQAGYYVVKDKDGNVYLYDNNGNVVQDKIYLRDTPWAKGTQWAGGAVYQGRLWTPEQIFNQNTAVSNAIGSELFDKLSGVSDPEEIRQAMLNSGWTVYGTNNPLKYETFDSSKNYLKGFMDSLNNGTYYWNDITGKYQLRDGDNTRILQVINGSNRDRDNTLKTQYAVSGYSGLFDSIEQLQNYLNTRGIQQAQGYRTYSPISQYEYVMNNGKRYLIAPGKRDIAGKEYNLYRDEEGRYYVDGNNGEIRELEGTGILDAIKNKTITAKDLEKGSLRRQNFGSVYDYGSYDQVFGFKKGGRIPILQMGGFFTTGSVGENKEKEQVENWVGQPQLLGADKRLKTSTDSLNKTAGWLDAAGLATSWIPGVGTGVGILGSLARFGADVKKDGFQWKDAGNLAINLGLDALTLIPGLGAVGKVAKAGSKAAKLAKTSNKVAKVARSITPMLSAAGAGTGVAQIAGALNNPEGMTSEDFGNLLSGIANVGLGSKNLVKNYKVAKVAKKLSGNKSAKTKDTFKINEKDKWLKRNAKKVGNFGNKVIHAPKNFVQNNGSTLNWMFNPWKQYQVDNLIAKNLKTLVKSKNNFEQSLAAEYLTKNSIRSTKDRTIGNKIYNGTQVNQLPWRNPKYELTSRNKPKSKSKTKSVVTTQNNKPVIAGLLPAWKGNNIPEVNILPSSNSPITTPSSSLIQIPQFASSYRNAQGQLLLPRGNGRFFKKTQRVWNGGPAHEIVPIQSAKYSATPKKPRFRNIGLEQVHKQRVLQEAGRQQVPAIRGLQEDIANVKTSEDFKNLLVKINNRGSYKEIIKNNPEIKDQLRQMFVHLDPVRLGNWMTKYNLRFKKGGKIVKAQNGVSLKPGDFVMDNDLNGANLYDYTKHGIQFNGSNVDWTKTYNTGSDFNRMRQIYIDNWNNPLFANARQAYINQLSTNNNNIDLTNFSLDDFKKYTSDQKLGWAHKLKTDAFNAFRNTLPEAVVTATALKMPEIKGKAEVQNPTRGIKISENRLTSNPNLISATTESNSKQDKSTGDDPEGRTKNPFNFNFNPDDLIGLGQMIGNIAANNKMYNRLEEGIKSLRGTMEAMPTEIYDRYQDHITPIYQEAANQKRQFFVPTSTDAITNYAMRQANEDQAQALLAEGRLKASEAYSQYLNEDLAARRTYADERRRVAQSNRERMANISMQLAQNDAARRISNWQSINNGILEFRNKLAQDRQRKINFMKQEDAIMAQRKYDEYVNKKMAEGDYYNQFNVLDDNKKKQYLNAQDWLMQTNPSLYESIVNGATVEALNYNRANRPKYLDYFRIDTTPLSVITPSSPVSMPAYLSYKKGGKTPTYLKRHTGQKPDEAIWIQRNKDTAKALEKLHDAVIKLFMKALS